MKPKTKIQKQIIELKERIPVTTNEHKQFAFSKHTNYVALAYKTKHDCLECGYTWKSNNKETIKNKGTICPSCNLKLKIKSNYSKNCYEKYYFAILNTIEDYQVVRIILSTKTFQKGQQAEHSINEVMQHYIDETGNIHSIEKPTQAFGGGYFDVWTYGTLEFRTKSQNSHSRQRLNPYYIYPKKQIIPVLKRNGIKNSTFGIAPQLLFKEIIQNNKIETLFKAKRYQIINAQIYNEIDINGFWRQIKLTIKNDYKIPNLSDWKDYIRLLMFFDKDVNNAKYVCPVDLNKEHNRYVEKKRLFDKAKRLKDLQKEIHEQDKLYQKSKKKFFGLIFQSKNITIEPLRSVQEFFEEGEDMKHCLFASEYYSNPKSLILSAKVNGKRTETIQISLEDFRIIQSRGYHNAKTKYNKKIKEIVQNNINQIQKIAYKKAS